MFNYINKIFKKRHYNNFIQTLNKESGVPQSASDWRVRAITCDQLIKKFSEDEKKTEALYRIKQESEEKAKHIEAQAETEYLSQFTSKGGYDKYIQVGGRSFAQEIWFHRDKSKITVINESGSLDYNMIGENPGKWYQYNLEGVTYEITLGTKLHEQILISIDDGKQCDSFTIDLLPIL